MQVAPGVRLGPRRGWVAQIRRPRHWVRAVVGACFHERYPVASILREAVCEDAPSRSRAYDDSVEQPIACHGILFLCGYEPSESVLGFYPCSSAHFCRGFCNRLLACELTAAGAAPRSATAAYRVMCGRKCASSGLFQGRVAG